MSDALPAERTNEPSDAYAEPQEGDWDAPSVGAAPGDAQRRTIRRVLAGMGALIVAALAVPIVVAVLHRPAPGVEVRYVIPPGTAERLAAGEQVDVLPQRIDLRTQDTLVIVNEDDETFAVGGLSVAGEQTMTYHFSKPGTYSGACQLHPGGNVDIVVD